MNDNKITMAKITFICPPLMGHITPMHQLASRLQTRGHEVSFIHFFDTYPFDCDFALYPVANDFLSMLREFRVDYNRIHDLKEPYGNFFRAVFDAVHKLCAEIRPDLMVMDHFFPVAELIAEELQLPYVCCYSSPDPFVSDSGEENPVSRLNAIIRQKGIESYTGYMQQLFGKTVRLFPFSPLLNICFASERIINTKSALFRAGRFHVLGTGKNYPVAFVGPALMVKTPSPADKQMKERIGAFPGRKVFISFGTVWSRLIHLKDAAARLVPVIRNTIRALNTSDTLLVYSGSAEILDEAVRGLSLKAALIRQDYVNQYHLLPAFDLVVFHGGYNTFAECMRQQVPVICAPMGWDQGNIARIILEQGTGERINLTHNTPEEIREKAGRLLEDETVARNIAALSADFKKNDGARNAAAAIEALLPAL